MTIDKDFIRKTVLVDLTRGTADCPKCGEPAKMVSETSRNIYSLTENTKLQYSNLQCKTCKYCFTSNDKERFPDRQMYTPEVKELVQELRWGVKKWNQKRIGKYLQEMYQIELSPSIISNWVREVTAKDVLNRKK